MTGYAAGQAAVAAGPQPPQRPALLADSLDDKTLRVMLAGGVAGCISKTITAPLARLTILYQVQSTDTVPGWSGGRSPTVREAAARVAREEGLLALWKGNGVTIVHRLPYSAINFFVYERLMVALSAGRPGRHRDDASAAAVGHRLIAGAAAGTTACAATYPLDLVRTRLAAQTTRVRYEGLRHALATIHGEEGARGLYRGLGATLVGVAPSLAINFAAYETLRGRAAAAAPNAPPAALALVAGSAAGAVSAICCFPLDLVRRRMQLADAPGGPPGAAAGSLRRMPSAAAAVLRRDGMRGFYRGIVPELGKVVPGVGIAFSVYEFAKRQLGCDT